MSSPVIEEARFNAFDRDFSSPLANAPAWIALLFCSLFLFLTVSLHYPSLVAFVVSLLVCIGWGLVGTVSPNRSSLPVCAALLLLCTLFALQVHRQTNAPEAFPGTIHSTGEVLTIREWGFRTLALVRLREEEGGKFLLSFEKERPELKPGDLLSFSGKTAPFERPETGVGFDEFLYWKAKGGLAKIANPKAEKIGVVHSPAYLRHRMTERIRATLPQQTAGYVMAVTTGERDSRLESLHRSVGTSHLLAVSGFHVGIVFLLGWTLFKRFRPRLVLISILIWAYTILTGAAPSAMRAAFMLQLVIAGRLAGRAGNSFNTASAAGCLLLLYNPWLFWDIGWRLSMLAILSVTSIVAADYNNRTKAILASPLVWLATAVQAAWTFDRVPLAGLVINFLAIPAFTFLFPIALGCSLPSLLGMPGGYIFVAIPEILFSMWERLSSNILYLCPRDVSFSRGLLFCALATVTFFFARASGFQTNRAILASVLVLFSAASAIFFV
ncbi:ComEC/Rec2 family competence protein [Synergistaceae bacterium OttesenSCG-928-I11]|nr:ComEC/Rec2 family competence protein [Synergistaceae bacterium OttesenSCG-928-I11]